MAGQVMGQVLDWAGMSDGARAGPRALSWAEVVSWDLDRAVMEADWGCYGLFVVVLGP